MHIEAFTISLYYVAEHNVSVVPMNDIRQFILCIILKCVTLEGRGGGLLKMM